MNIIVTDVHYRSAVAVLRDLSEAGHRIIGCESDAFPHNVGFASKHCHKKVLLPRETYGEALLKLCQKEREQSGEPPVLLVIGAVTLRFVCENRRRFLAVCRSLIPQREHLQLLNDKMALADTAKALAVPVPRDYRQEDGESADDFFRRVPLPCVVKPLCGEQFGLKAAQRYAICRTAEELQRAYHHFTALTETNPVVQEYLSGAALGCSVLARDGAVLAHLCHHRLREYPVSGGPSCCCEAIADPVLLQYATAITEHLGFSGVAMFEFKGNGAGEPRLLECNPRIWGSYPLTRAAETNFSLLWAQASAALPTAEFRPAKAVKMHYQPSDAIACLKYLKKGDTARALRGFGDMLSPAVKSGLFAFGDMAPGWRYFLDMLKRMRNR